MRTLHRRRLGGAARRETILAAAIPEFAAAGYERARVGDIAARVGVTEPVVFQNFGTKSALFVQVLERMSNEIVRHLAALRDQHPDIADQLSMLLSHDMQQRIHGSGGMGALFAQAATSGQGSIRAAGKRAHRQMVLALAALLRRGQVDGSIRADVGAADLALLVISQIHAQRFRMEHGETTPALEQAMERALLVAMRPTRPA